MPRAKQSLWDMALPHGNLEGKGLREEVWMRNKRMKGKGLRIVILAAGLIAAFLVTESI